MRPLELDYLRQPRPRLAAYVLAAFAAAFAADAAMHYRDLQQDAALKERRLASRAKLYERHAAPKAARSMSQDEYALARDTVRRLGTPWHSLFRALEASHSGKIALLAVEPDVANRAVSITGEANDYLSALSYVAQLSAQEELSRVHLVRHEHRAGGPRPLAFTVSASWKEGR